MEIYYVFYDFLMSIFVGDVKNYKRPGGNRYGGDNKKKYNGLKKSSGSVPAGGG